MWGGGQQGCPLEKAKSLPKLAKWGLLRVSTPRLPVSVGIFFFQGPAWEVIFCISHLETQDVGAKGALGVNLVQPRWGHASHQLSLSLDPGPLCKKGNKKPREDNGAN